MAAPLCLRSASATERIGGGVSFGSGWFETLPLQFWGGLTLEEALAASEEAILSHIEVLLMDGESVPKQRAVGGTSGECGLRRRRVGRLWMLRR